MIECPRFLFPFARRIIADLTGEGGFPPFMLEPIDFAGIYAAARPARPGSRSARPTRCHRPVPATSQASSQTAPASFSASRTKAACAARSSRRWSGGQRRGAAGRRRRGGRLPTAAPCADHGEVEPALAAALQLQIDVGQQLGVDQAPCFSRSASEILKRLQSASSELYMPGKRFWARRQGVDPARLGQAARGPTRSSSALMKSRSKAALWAMSAASPTNSRNASTTSASPNFGLSARKASRDAVHPLGLEVDRRAPGRRSGGTSGRWG